MESYINSHNPPVDPHNMSTHNMFTSLPSELQLSIVDECDAKSMAAVMETSQHMRNLCLYSLNKKMSRFTNGVNISAFSPQAVEQNSIKTFETSLANTPCNTKAETLNSENIHALNRLLENINQDNIAGSQMEEGVLYKTQHNTSETSTKFHLERPTASGNPLVLSQLEKPIEAEGLSSTITVLVDEDSSTIKLHLNVSLPGSKTVFSIVKKVSKNLCKKESSSLAGSRNEFNLSFKVTEGEVEPPKGPYDYEEFTNYHIDLSSLTVSNLFFLWCTEQKETITL